MSRRQTVRRMDIPEIITAVCAGIFCIKVSIFRSSTGLNWSRRRKLHRLSRAIDQYFICSACGKLFLDEDGYHEVGIEDVTIPVPEPDPTDEPVPEPSEDPTVAPSADPTEEPEAD